MHPKKGQFKVNAQRLKPYFGEEFHTGKQDSKGVEGHQQFGCFSSLSVVHCRNVELTTLNIALLRRQPKYCEIPFFFELALISVFFIALR